MKIRLGKVGALLGAAVLLSNTAMAGVVAGTAFANSNAPSSATLQPGQTYTVTANITATGSAAGLTFNQIALNPNLASQFQIVGGTCNTTTQYIAPTTCTVQVLFLGNQPGAATADLRMGCSAILAAAGGYGINCTVGGGPGTVATMARFVGSGVAAVVDALGREGLTLLAAALFALTAWTSLRRPNQSRTPR